MKVLTTLFLLPLAGFQSPTFEVRGVCAIDAATVDCWAPDGGPKPGLTEEVRRQIAAMESPLSFLPGRKNRFVIVRHTPFGTLTYGKNSLRPQNFPLEHDGGLWTTAFRIAADRDVATADITIIPGFPEGEAVAVPFHEGAKAVVDGVPVEIGRIGKNPRDEFGGFNVSRVSVWGEWRLPIQIGETTAPSGYQVMPVGHDGKPISYVDPQGWPVDARRGKELWEAAFKSERRIPESPPASPAGISTYPSGPILWVGMDIQPKAIHELQIRRIAGRMITLGPLALDPNPQSVP